MTLHAPPDRHSLDSTAPPRCGTALERFPDPARAEPDRATDQRREHGERGYRPRRARSGRRTAAVTLLGHKGDLMLVHFRRGFEGLQQAQLDVANQLNAEQRYPVSPLAADAVALFRERARAHDPAFHVSDANAGAVAGRSARAGSDVSRTSP